MFCVLWENCQNHLESLLFQKGQSVWKKISSRAVIQRCHCELEFCWIFCWGAKLIAAWNVSLLKDFGGMAWQITASDLPRPDKSVVYCGFMFFPARIQKCWIGRLLTRRCPQCGQRYMMSLNAYERSFFPSLLSPWSVGTAYYETSLNTCAQYNILKMTHKFQM